MNHMMEVLIRNVSKECADEYSLVLHSIGISHVVDKDMGSYSIKVGCVQKDVAIKAINRYRAENPNITIQTDEKADPVLLNFSGVFVAVLLLTIHLAVAGSMSEKTYAQAYGASAFHILGGEIFRSVTALLLHGDVAHLAGNMAGIALFGSVLCSGTGTGAGWLMILTSGMLGNLLNAALFRTGHLSIGASTAVFGAVGLLTAIEFIKALTKRERRKKAIWTAGGGLAVLSFMGAAPHTDITAHLFGFSAGVILGIAYKVLVKKRASATLQTVMVMLTAAIVIASWVAGLPSN